MLDKCIIRVAIQWVVMKTINRCKAADKEKLQEFIRFCIVGILCTGIDVAVFYLVRLFASYQISLVSGYLLSLFVNYFLTLYWTFKAQPNMQNTVGIVLAHLFNLFMVRMGLMLLFVDLLRLSDKIAYLPTLVISVVTNFVIIKYVVHKYRKK